MLRLLLLMEKLLKLIAKTFSSRKNSKVCKNALLTLKELQLLLRTLCLKSNLEVLILPKSYKMLKPLLQILNQQKMIVNFPNFQKSFQKSMIYNIVLLMSKPSLLLEKTFYLKLNQEVQILLNLFKMLRQLLLVEKLLKLIAKIFFSRKNSKVCKNALLTLKEL